MKNIKSFLWRFLIFSIIAAPFIVMNVLYSYYEVMVRGLELNATEVYLSIMKSNKKQKVNVLIFGDSVANQLYSNADYSDSVYSLACNQAVTMAGHYLLLQNFIKANQGQLPKKVVFIIRPATFESNIDQHYSYNYFVKPFYKAEYKPYFTPACEQQIKRIPFYFASQVPIVLKSNWCPNYFVPPDPSFKCISQITNDYLPKIKTLCDSNHIQFVIVSPPIEMFFLPADVAYSKCTDEFKKCGMEAELNEYFKHVPHLPDSLFVDAIHFKKPYIPVDYFNFRKN